MFERELAAGFASAVAAATARCTIKLSDAREVKTATTDIESGGEGAPVSEVKVGRRIRQGYRFERCGGGVRVVRRQRRRD